MLQNSISLDRFRKLKDLLMYHRNKRKYFIKNTFYRPWGRYTNLFNGNNFLIKEIYVKSKGILSLKTFS